MVARVKPVFKCPDEFKSKFNSARGLLTISVGQEVHEGDKLAATIDLVNNAFKEIIILVDDTVQRHTMKLYSNLYIEHLYLLALKAGDEWLKRNANIYEKMTIPFKIMRWDHWLNHANYHDQHRTLYNRYLSDPFYQKQFDITIREFLARHDANRKVANLTSEDCYTLCLNYLLEECTALCLWVDEKINFEIYPSKRNAAMVATHELYIKPQYPHLLLPVAIKFKNRKQFTPQKFLFNTV